MVWNGTNIGTLGKIQLIVIKKRVKKHSETLITRIRNSFTVSISMSLYILLWPDWSRGERGEKKRKLVHFLRRIPFTLPLAYFTNGSLFSSGQVFTPTAFSSIEPKQHCCCETAWLTGHEGNIFSLTDWLWHKSFDYRITQTQRSHSKSWLWIYVLHVILTISWYKCWNVWNCVDSFNTWPDLTSESKIIKQALQ